MSEPSVYDHDERLAEHVDIIGAAIAEKGAEVYPKPARLLALQPKAIQRLDWLLDREEFPSTMYQAIKDVMDRTVGRAPETVDMYVNVDWEKRIARIKAARRRIG